jgi:metal-responsive CopG/Arc/MetJ family transcriptional regulator
MKNVQISVDETLLKTIDAFAATYQLSRSALVREAVKAWIRQKKIKEFENEWIRKLVESPQDVKESEAWLAVQSWGEK